MAKQTRGRKSLRRSKKHSKRNVRRSLRKLRGGAGYEMGSAPLSYNLADGWSSKMSLNQGGDFFKYHADQHGGGLLSGADYNKALTGEPFLSGAAAASARVEGLNNAITYSAQFKDPMPPALVDNRIVMPETSPQQQPQQKGGKRRRSGKKAKKSKKAQKSKKAKKSKKAQKSKKSKKVKKTVRRRRQGGGSLGFASVNSPGLLLPNKAMYDDAGLNPEFRGAAAEYWSADQRDAV